MATKAQSRSSAKYDKAHTKGVYLNLDLEIDIRAARFKLLAFNSVLIALVFFDFDFVKYCLTFNNQRAIIIRKRWNAKAFNLHLRQTQEQPPKY